jgi:hypothetical protein
MAAVTHVMAVQAMMLTWSDPVGLEMRACVAGVVNNISKVQRLSTPES